MITFCNNDILMHKGSECYHVGDAGTLIILREGSGDDIEGVRVKSGKVGDDAGHNTSRTSGAAWVRALSKPHTLSLSQGFLSNCCLLLLLIPCHPPILPLL